MHSTSTHQLVPLIPDLWTKLRMAVTQERLHCVHSCSQCIKDRTVEEGLTLSSWHGVWPKLLIIPSSAFLCTGVSDSIKIYSACIELITRYLLQVRNSLCGISTRQNYCCGKKGPKQYCCKTVQSPSYCWTMYINELEFKIRCCYLMLNSPWHKKAHREFHFLLSNKAIQVKHWEEDKQ